MKLTEAKLKYIAVAVLTNEYLMKKCHSKTLIAKGLNVSRTRIYQMKHQGEKALRDFAWDYNEVVKQLLM